MRRLAGLLAALLLAALPGAALADAAGSALGVRAQAAANTSSGLKTLVVGDDIFIGDVVQTGTHGQVQILFTDKTELVVGPSSSLRIEDYLIRNDGSAGALAVNMLSGAFRFATGDSAKARYKLSTPTGTIGVRGTGFDVHVAPDGVTRILLYHGAVRFCTFDGDCKDLTNFCEVGQIEDIVSTLIGDSRELRDLWHQLRGEFLYANDQSSLLRQFWMQQARECVNPKMDLPISTDDDDTPPKPTRPGPNCIGTHNNSC